MPSPVLSTGLVVTAKSWPGAAGGQQHVAGPHLDAPAVGRRAATHPAAPTALDHAGRARTTYSCTAAAVRLHRLDQRPLDLGARGRAAGVHDPRAACARPRGPARGALLVAVEDGAERDELVHPSRALVDQHPHGVGVAQAGAGGQRVGQVQVGRVRVLAEHGGHAALGPAGRRLRQLALGEHADPHAVGAGGADGGRQAGHAAAQDEQVERFDVGRRSGRQPIRPIARARSAPMASGPLGRSASSRVTGRLPASTWTTAGS